MDGFVDSQASLLLFARKWGFLGGGLLLESVAG